MSIYSESQSKNIQLGIIVMLSAFLLISALYIMTALLCTALLYILFKPLFLYLKDKKKLAVSLSAIIVILLSFLIIVLPLLGLSVMIIGKLTSFQKHPEAFLELLTKIQAFAGPHFDLKDMLYKSINEISIWSIGAFSFFMSGALKLFVSLIVMYFTLYFMLKSHLLFESTLLNYLPFSKNNSLKFTSELKKVTYSNIVGQGFIGLSQGLVVVLGFYLFGIPDPIFWGVLSVFVCFLPIVGAPIIFVPAGIIQFINGHAFSGIGIIIWGTVFVVLIDNFLRLLISRKIADIHPLITILGVTIGVPVFGLIGIVIGPLLLTALLLLFKIYRQTYFKIV